MSEDFVAKALAEIAAKKAAREAAPATAPATPTAAPPVAAAQTVETPVQPLVQEEYQKPTDCPQADWDAWPPDVRRLVAGGPQAQAVPVNPPEAAQGLIESATGRVLETTEKPGEKPAKERKTRTPKAPAIDLGPVVSELQALRETQNNRELCLKLEDIGGKIEQLTQALLGAAQILAGS